MSMYIMIIHLSLLQMIKQELSELVIIFTEKKLLI